MKIELLKKKEIPILCDAKSEKFSSAPDMPANDCGSSRIQHQTAYVRVNLHKIKFDNFHRYLGAREWNS